MSSYFQIHKKQRLLLILLWIFAISIILGVIPIIFTLDVFYIEYAKYVAGIGCAGLLSWGVGIWGKGWEDS
jgi:hypothetical protein